MAKQKKNTRYKGNKNKANSSIIRVIEQQASQTARDMKDWREAKIEASRIEEPKRVRQADLIEDLLYDTFLSSQMETRVEKNLGEPFQILDRTGKVYDEGTKLLQDSIQFGELLKHLYQTPFFGHTLLELLPPPDDDICQVSLIPRRHVIPQVGGVLLDVSDDKFLPYRSIPSYGSQIIEIGDSRDLGILFDCAPATIYRRYAWSAWSEFCEIYGIPPRILKMDTMDDIAFENAKRMMKQMGSSNWAIVDHTEEMNFASGMSDNGDIFHSLIQAAKEDISIKICGAQIGQDTKNGNRSKEEVSIGMLEKKCLSDRRNGKKIINSTILPALSSLGIIQEGVTLTYPNDDEEDNDELWERTVAILPHYDVEPQWIKDKFHIEVREKKTASLASQQVAQLKAGGEEKDFF